MARMIPDLLDPTTRSHAERVMYHALQNGLDRDWTVIHGLSWLDDSRSWTGEGECDFVLLHPQHGLMAMEVKSGVPHYADGVWRHDDGHRMKDPFAQVRDAVHYLDRLLSRRVAGWAEAQSAFGSMVAFPDADRVTGALPPHVTPEVLLLESDLDHLQRRVVGALARRRPPTDVPAHVVHEALRVLRPKFRLVPSLRAELSRVDAELVRLTEIQQTVLRAMATNPRLVVTGGAGTGKTLLVCEQARRLAAEGRRVLVLCFNRSLAGALAQMLAEAADRVTVRTFHALCVEMADHASPGYKASLSGKPPAFWNETVVEDALAAAADYPHRYDAVLVDEAQDFREGWWVLLEELLADGAAYQIFLDPHQDVYGGDGVLPFDGPRVELPLNCRNTRPIAAWAHAAAGLPRPSSLERLPDGPPPTLVRVADADEEVDQVRRTLHELIHERRLDPSRIVVLGRHRLSRSAFAERRKLGNVTILGRDDAPQPLGVRYETIHRFKGLDADVVLLTGVGEPTDTLSEQQLRTLLYIGATRARGVLYVFGREGVEWGWCEGAVEACRKR